MCMIVSFTLHTPSCLLVQLLTTSLVKMIVGFDPFTTKIPSPEKTKTLMEGSRSVSVMRLKEQTFTVFPVCVCVQLLDLVLPLLPPTALDSKSVLKCSLPARHLYNWLAVCLILIDHSAAVEASKP